MFQPLAEVATALRAPSDTDIPLLGKMRNDLPTQYSLLASPKPNSLDDVRAWIERRCSDPSGLFFVIADRTGSAVGFTQVVEIDRRSRHGAFGIAVDHRHRGQGHARRALGLLVERCTADGRLDKLILQVAADNAAARAIYSAQEFRDVGTLRRHYRGPERWHDVTIMERFLGGAA